MSIISDDIINALDFSFKYNQSKFSWDTIEQLPGYKLQTTAFFNNADQTVRFTSNSFQNYTLSGPVVNIWFDVLSGQFTKDDIQIVAVYLNGEPCSFKIISQKPAGDCSSPPGNTKASDTIETSVTLSWSANVDAKSYIIRYREQGEQFWKEIIDIKTNLYIVEGLKPGTTYEWIVQNVCATAGNWSTISSFSTKAKPVDCSAAPDNLAVTDTTDTSAKLSWTKNINAKSYNLRYRKVGQTFWNQINDILTNSFFLDGLQPDASYEWNVQNVCGTAGNWSANSQFKTKPKAIDCSTPPENLAASDTTDSSVTLTWSENKNAKGYNIRYRKVGQQFWNQITGIPNNNIVLDGLQSGTTYEWNVQNQCTTSAGWSSTSEFTTKNDVGFAILSGENKQFQLFPNPTQGQNPTLFCMQEAFMEVFDSKGALIYSSIKLSPNTGYQINTLDLPDGLYFIRLNLKGNMSLLPLLVD